MLHNSHRIIVHGRPQHFRFIHRHSLKGPIIDIIAANLEAAKQKLSKHVPNANEWRRATEAEMLKFYAEKVISEHS